MKKVTLVLALIVLCSCQIAFAQRTITGTVTDAADGSTLPGVNVVAKGTKIGTATNVDGVYTLSVPADVQSLTFSFIGYESKSANIGKNSKVDVVLKSSIKALDEIVIVGVTAQSKRKTLSAISTVSGKQIENIPAASVDAVLQGKVAGLNVQISSGEPGVAPTMVVRGNSKVSQGIGNSDVAQSRALSGPLYVIDGVPINPEDIDNTSITGTNYMAGINMNDIESIDVQRDASAKAAWGSRGANGVIYIKTKRGKSTTPEFRLNMYGGFAKRPELLQTALGQDERAQKLALMRQYGTWNQIASQIPQILTDSLNPSYNNATDWQGMFYRETAYVKNVDATISAATDKFNYRVSTSYYDEQGIIKSFGYKRFNVRGNFDFEISKKLNAQLIIGTSNGNRQRGMKYNNSDNNTPVSNANMPSSLYRLNASDSALYLGLSGRLRNENKDNTYSASLKLNYEILPSLKYSFLSASNVSLSNRDYFQPSNEDITNDISDTRAAGKSSYAESEKRNYTTYYIENNLSFIKTADWLNHSHNFVIVGSQQFNRDVENGSWVTGYNVPSNDIQVVQGVPQSDRDGGSSYGASALLSFLGQLNYDIDGRYLMSLTYRGDASSRFGNNNKWGTFPSAGFGWIISDEKFMSSTKKVISFLKIRASYGNSGTNSPDFYAPYNSYNIPGYYNGQAVIQPDYNNGLTKNNYTWSQTTDKNLGIDLQLFDSRLNISFDAYDKLTKNDFYSFQLPFFTGFDNVDFNAKDLWVSNKGYEFNINGVILPNSSKLKWNTQLIVSHNQNLIAKLPNNNRTFVVGDNSGIDRIYAVGQPVYEMFQMHYQGVFNHLSDIPFDPITGKKITYFKGYEDTRVGDPNWQDVNKDGDLWADEDNGDQYGDRQPTGDPNPKFTGGWTNDFQYKNFTLSIISVFTFKRDVFNTYFQEQISQIVGGYSSSVQSFANSRLPDLRDIDNWTPAKAQDPNYQAGFPSINPFGRTFYQYIPFTDMWVVDGSYFKVKMIALGYIIPQSVISKLKIKQARVYAMGDNVLTFKKSTMPNPELVNQLGVYTGGQYPSPVKITLGIDVTF